MAARISFASDERCAMVEPFGGQGDPEVHRAPKARDGCIPLVMSLGRWELLHAASAPSREPELEKQPAGQRRNWTSDFEEVRARQRRASTGPRLEWLASIAGGQQDDARALAHFVDSGRATRNSRPSETCVWCNARITTRPAAAMRLGGSSAVGDLLARACEVCARWHCERCRVHREDLGTLFVGGGGRTSAAAQNARSHAELECCSACHRFIDALRWRQELLPACLAASSAQLLATYRELSLRMTGLAGALAQLEGLSRLAEIHPDDEGSGNVLPDEFRDALSESLGAAADAEGSVQTATSAVSKVACSKSPLRDLQLREALVRHGKRMLEDLRPRLSAARARAVAAAPGVEPPPVRKPLLAPSPPLACQPSRSASPSRSPSPAIGVRRAFSPLRFSSPQQWFSPRRRDREERRASDPCIIVGSLSSTPSASGSGAAMQEFEMTMSLAEGTPKGSSSAGGGASVGGGNPGRRRNTRL